MSARALRVLPVVALVRLLACTDAAAAAGGEPPRFQVPATGRDGPLVFVVYGDTRFTERAEVANAYARRALVERIAQERPAAVLIGGDLVYDGSDPHDYQTYKTETAAWANQNIPVYPALGNHELQGCGHPNPCLENWWTALSPLALRPYRWYSVSIGPSILALVLDSDSALKPGSEQRMWFEKQILGADQSVRFILILLHYPPVRDPLIPRAREEAEVASYLSHNAAKLRQRVVVVGSHVHNYERYLKDSVPYLVSGGGGAKPVRSLRIFGERSRLRTSVNFHYIRFTLEDGHLRGTMVRFDASSQAPNPWTEPDHFEVKAKD
jgi:acid phosphatase type 7